MTSDIKILRACYFFSNW